MRLSLERDMSGQRGWSNFMRTLVDSLQKNHGVILVDKNSKSDIHLSVISGFKKGSKNITRIDGVYYDINRLKRNDSIRSSLNTSDGVIFQSKWCHTFATNMLKVYPKNYTVVFNGVNQEEIKQAKPIPLDNLGFDKIWISCAHFRVNKRPEAIAQAFLKAREKSKQNIGMVFVGAFKDERMKLQDSSIKYLNEIEHSQLFGYFKSADWMVHICHVDSCPNSVIEGLSSGLPVLSNNIGGTPEIVGKNGLVVNLDKPFSYTPLTDMKFTGSKYVDKDVLADGMIKMMEQKWEVSRPDLDINVTAKQYYDFFIKVLKT